MQKPINQSIFRIAPGSRKQGVLIDLNGKNLGIVEDGDYERLLKRLPAGAYIYINKSGDEWKKVLKY